MRVNWRALQWAMFGVGSLLVLGMLWALAAGPGAGRAHDVEVGVVGPGLAVDLLATDQVDHVAQATLSKLADRDSAVDSVSDHSAVAAVVMDLSGTTDEVLVDRARDPELVAATLDEIRIVEHEFGRTVRVTDLNADASDRAHRIDWAVVWASVCGFLIGLGAVIVRWARIRPTGRVPRVVVILLGSSAAVALGLVNTMGPFAGNGALNTAVLFATTICAALMPLAFAAAAEGTGMAWALLLFTPSLLPLILHLDTHLLAEPWRTLHPFTSIGAAREALAWTHVDIRSLMVLVAWWVAISVIGIRSLRPRPDRRLEPLPLATAMKAAVPSLLVILLAAWRLPTAVDPRPDTDALASTTECVYTGTPTSVKQINQVTRSAKGGQLFGGGDVGASAPLQDGRSVWVFGTSVRGGSAGEEAQLVGNSMLLFDDDCLAVVAPADGGAVIPDRRGTWYWPMSVTTDRREGYDVVMVSAARLKSDQRADAAAIRTLGPAVASYLVPRGGTPQLLGVTDFARLPRPDAPLWGAALARAEDGWVYVYGTARDPQAFGYSLHVARVRPEQALDQRRWRYWDGTAWVKDSSRSARLVEAVNGVSQTLSVWQGSNGTWYALSKQNDVLGTGLVIWSAPAPQGPFTAHPAVADIPSDTESGHLRYAPLAHPELLPQPGSVVVSYSNNRTDQSQILNDPRLYRPTFLRVPLPR